MKHASYVDPVDEICDGIEFFFVDREKCRKVIWDLEENELLKEQFYLPNANTSERFNFGIIRNEERSLVIVKQQSLVQSTYCRLDLEWAATLIDAPEHIHQKYDFSPLVANFRDQNVLSAFVLDSDDKKNLKLIV